MDYRATLNLPQTKFKMKANLAQNEPMALKEWAKADLYGKVQAASEGRPLYVLHDGPPYANGHLHLGHALNKILKDIILKAKRMEGYHCPYVPGWDCHGLPIEHNVDKELGAKKKEIPTLSFRGACRKYAEKWVKTQKEEFKRLGVLADWENPYRTIDFSYEASIAREFNRFLLNGSVVRSKKPVYWCSSCKTALAEAEVEYHDHTSPSIYVKFPVADDLSDLVPELAGKTTFAVIWTTTPWTLPANLAVAFHPDFPYAAVEVNGEVWILAEGLVAEAFKDFEIDDYKILATFSATGLEGRKCKHPFLERDSLMVLANYVTLDSGTGCVHTAPGHGRDDYMTGLRYKLPVLSPLDNSGCFTDEAGPYAGMKIADANGPINADIAARGLLVKESKVSHSYPHCWRCKNPVIFRATEQWFISMDNNDLRDKSLAAIKEAEWIPSWGRERIYGMVEGRPDWCLSRQRAWGVPLTVISCEKCGQVMNDQKVADRIVASFVKEGADAWYKHEISEYLEAGAACPDCGGTEFVKEQDILDVWFDSGVSYAAVLEGRDDLATPADLYLEGSDQHRGWFHSSLLASVGTRGVAPYRGVLTHGFVVDGKGKKMSKSIGNVIAPSEVIKQYGAEILRLWVASEDYRDDVKISDEILRQLSDAYRKIRNTMRYLLSNLYDFDPDADQVALVEMGEIDLWALSQFEQLKRKVRKSYDSFEFHAVYHSISHFCTVTMSSFYLDIIKDRLYTEAPNSTARRAAQTVLYEIAEGLLRLMTPVLSFTAAETWAHLPPAAEREENVFVAKFPADRDEYLHPELDDKWARFLVVRSELTKVLELARREKVIGHSLEAEVLVTVTGELADFLEANWQTMKTIAIVSDLIRVEKLEGEFQVSEELPELAVQVRPAASQKCERCWTRAESVGSHDLHPQLCGRCVAVVAEL